MQLGIGNRSLVSMMARAGNQVGEFWSQLWSRRSAEPGELAMAQVEGIPAAALIAAAGDAGGRVIEHEGLRGRGDHGTLSRAEIEVFGIIPALDDALDDAHTRYEGFLGLVDGLSDDFDGQVEADREQHQEYLPGSIEDLPFYDPRLAALFMQEVCGLPYDQCWAWVWKQEFVLWREGLFVLPDEIVSEDYRRRVREADASDQTTPPEGEA